MNVVRDITLKLEEESRRNFEGRYISVSRSAVHKNRNSDKPFLVFALCYATLVLLIIILKTTGIYYKAFIFDIFKGHSMSQGSPL